MKFFIRLTLILSFTLIIIGTFIFIKNPYKEIEKKDYVNYERRIVDKKGNIEIEKVSVNEKENNEIEILEKIKLDYKIVKNKNEDLIAWINVPNVCYLPICYKDNSFYLTHNEYKEDSKAGCLFLNMHCEKDFNGISLIHGHHMRNGSMFGNLEKYIEEDFAKENSEILIYNGESFQKYELHSVTYYVDGKETIPVDLKGKKKLNYFAKLKEESIVNTSVKYLNPLKNCIGLSTCEYSKEDNRLLVFFVEK